MSEIISIFFIVLYVYTILTTISVLLLENRNPSKSLSWMLIILFLPVIGLILYLIFGQDLRKQKIISRKSIHSLDHRDIASFDISKINSDLLDAHQMNLIKLLYRNSEAVGYAYNKIEVFSDGKEAFESIFQAVEQAREHIHLEFYIISDDSITNRLKDLLIKKSHEGVRIRIIYDFIGSFNLSRKFLKTLTKAGIYVRPFFPLRFRISRSRINYRNHRKLLVVDGKVAFTGGMNIADRYVYGNRLGYWRDTFLKIQGSAVHGLQHLFLSDWYFVEKKLITDKKYYPVPAQFDNNLVQIVSSGPDTEWEAIMQGIAKAIMSAKKYIYIQSPYYMPTELIEGCLQLAALSGIDVRIMIPTQSDSSIVIASTSSYLGKVLQAGVRVFYYRKGFLHAKTVVMDDFVSIVGSCNIDYRSFYQNFEANAFVYEEKTALTLKELFLEDILHCEEITLEQWNNRKKTKKLMDSVSRLFSPLL